MIISMPMSGRLDDGGMRKNRCYRRKFGRDSTGARELRLIRGEEQQIEWWSSLDALVLKAMTIVLTEHLQPVLSPRCFHVAGNGGLKGAVREVAANLSDNTFVFRTDVKGYYASINHSILMEIVGKYVRHEAVLCLLWGDLRRYVSDGGDYVDITQGISLGRVSGLRNIFYTGGDG